jgi:uncharacterized Zn-binding protein involved in type VI secretion
MPPAARITDTHTCPMVHPGPVPHVGGPVVAGCASVLIGHEPAARVSDAVICEPAQASIAAGSPSVIIGHQQAARVGDPTSHGGVVVAGCPTVIIGPTPQASALIAASASGAPFCAECEKARKAAEEKKRRQGGASS